MPGRITALINQAEKAYSKVTEIIDDMKDARASMPTGRYSERTKQENIIRENAWLYECSFAQADLEKLCEMLKDKTGDE